MNCYYHQDKVSVGVCRHCFRGVCSICAVDFDGGLACRGKCEQEAKRVACFLQTSMKNSESYKQIYAASNKTIYIGSLFFMSVGLAYIGIPWFYDNDDGGWTYIIGGIFVIFGFALALRGRKLKPMYDELAEKKKI